jgi:hypothetical protein
VIICWKFHYRLSPAGSGRLRVIGGPTNDEEVVDMVCFLLRDWYRWTLICRKRKKAARKKMAMKDVYLSVVQAVRGALELADSRHSWSSSILVMRCVP